MQYKHYRIILFFLYIPLSVLAADKTDYCTSMKKSVRCEFGSLKMSPDTSVFFYCRTNWSDHIEMQSKDVLIRGFNGSIKTGTGKLELNRKSDKKILNSRYFRVLLSPLSTKNPSVQIYADRDITCNIGQGLMRSEMSGNFD